jgi:CheY-like chemotaxis protein
VIINDILSLSKIEEGMIELETIDFNLKTLLENICAINKEVVADKNISLNLNYADSLPPGFKGDPVRLGQVIANLVNNAIKFTPAGEVSINARLVDGDNCNAGILFEIADTGIGIPAEKQEYIFEIFTQASSETTRKFGGVGLGLAISRKLVKCMGGDLKVKSKAGEGSTFYFTLNLPVGECFQTVTPIDQKETKSDDAVKGSRVLLAEDNPINVLVVKRYLDQWGIVCDVAENGQIALEMLRANDYDMVLMDLQMPVMDGFEASMQIRNMPDNHASIPIIALTASVVGDVKEPIQACGMNDWISKPFNPAELLEKLKMYIQKPFFEHRPV